MKLELAQMINSVVDAMLPRCTEDKILLLTADVSYEVYDERFVEDNGNRFSVHFAFYRPGSYTKVLFGTSERSFSISNGDILTHTSDHDSCWRDDGVRSPLHDIHRSECNRLLDMVDTNDKYVRKSIQTDCHELFYRGGQPHHVSITQLKVVPGKIERGPLGHGDYKLSIADGFFTFKEQPEG